jgi:hypothetical protein
MVLLFLVLFYVYPLKFVFTLLFAEINGASVPGGFGWHEGSVLMRVYAAGFASVFLLFALMYAHAYNLREELGLNEIEVLETRSVVVENVILTFVGLVSFLIALKYPEWAGWVYAAIAPLMWINGSIHGKRVRALAKKMPELES